MGRIYSLDRIGGYSMGGVGVHLLVDELHSVDAVYSVGGVYLVGRIDLVDRVYLVGRLYSMEYT